MGEDRPWGKEVTPELLQKLQVLMKPYAGKYPEKYKEILASYVPALIDKLASAEEKLRMAVEALKNCAFDPTAYLQAQSGSMTPKQEQDLRCQMQQRLSPMGIAKEALAKLAEMG